MTVMQSIPVNKDSEAQGSEALPQLLKGDGIGVGNNQDNIELQIAHTLSQINEMHLKRADALRSALKSILLVIQQAHQSQLFVTHDALTGILGVITSAMDMVKLWPTKTSVK